MLMTDWEEQEKKGELDTMPPPSPESSNEDYEIVEAELADKANDEAPTT